MATSNRNLRRQTALILALGIMSGCAAVNPDPAVPRPKPALTISVDKSAALLYYFDRVLNMTPAELSSETENARKLYANEKSNFRLLQYALALAVPGGDIRRAQQVLEPLLKDTSGRDRELHALAILINADLSERRRLEGSIQTVMRRAEDAESKLGALKEIEKNMMQQEGTTGGKK